MSFKKNFITEMNKKLMEKRFSSDIQTTLNIPEHKFKKISEKFNYAIKTIYDDYAENGTKMFHILLALQEYFDMKWLVENVLDIKNRKIIEEEMSIEFNIKKDNPPVKRRKRRKRK